MDLPRNPTMRRWLALSPSMLVIGIFMVIPMGILLVFSFMHADPYGGVDPGFTFDAYVQILFERDFDDELLFDPIYLNIIGRSLGLAALATIACLILGFPVAYYITRQSPEVQSFLLFLVTLPFWTNLLVRTYAWILILSSDGIIEQPLKALGMIEDSLNMMYTNAAVGIGLIYTYIPLMVLPIYASLEKLDFRLIEAAHDLYASRIEVAKKIIIPLASPGIIAGCILVLIPSLGAFVAPNLLGGGKKLMMGSLIQNQFASARNWPFGAALSMCLLALVMLALFYQARVAARRRAQTSAG